MRPDDYELLRQMIQEETLFLRHYSGKVVDNQDEMNAGRVKVMIEELGFYTPDSAIWCFPRQGSGMSVPIVGAFVEVYFMNGDRTRPVYLHLYTDLVSQVPRSYTGPRMHVLFQSPESAGDSVTFNAENQELALLSGSEHYVLGDTLKTELQKVLDQLTQLATDFSTWSPVAHDGGAALKAKVAAGFLTKPAANISGILSELIKGK